MPDHSPHNEPVSFTVEMEVIGHLLPFAGAVFLFCAALATLAYCVEKRWRK